MNPVFLKEIRQSVRSRLVTVSLLGTFLLLLVIIGIIFANDASDYYSRSGRINSDLGLSVFYTVSTLLLFVSFIVIPYGAFHRLLSEHQQGSTDLLFTTPLTPSKIVDGKLMSNAALALLFFAATLPFTLLSYQLHGVSPTYIAVLLVYFLPTVLCLLSIALAFALLPFPPVITRILFILFNLSNFVSFPLGIAAGTYYSDRSDFNENSLLVLAALLTLIALCRAFSIFVISPTESNRARPLRVTLLVLWLAYTLLMVIWPLCEQEVSLLSALFTVVFGLLILFLLHAISLRPTPSRRTLAEIRPRFRFIQFLFYTSSDGGVLLYLILSLLTFLYAATVEWLILPTHSLFKLKGTDLYNFLPVFFSFTAIALLYRRIGIHFRYLRNPITMMLAPPLIFSLITGFYSCFYDILPTLRHPLLKADTFSLLLFLLSLLVFLPGAIRSYRAFRAPPSPKPEADRA